MDNSMKSHVVDLLMEVTESIWRGILIGITGSVAFWIIITLLSVIQKYNKLLSHLPGAQ